MKLLSVLLLSLIGCMDYEAGICDYCHEKRKEVVTNAYLECKKYHVSCGRERPLWRLDGKGFCEIKVCPKPIEAERK